MVQLQSFVPHLTVTAAAAVVVVATSLVAATASNQPFTLQDTAYDPNPIDGSSTASSTIANRTCETNCTSDPSDVFYFSPHARSILYNTTIVGACLSILGTSLITLSYIIYPALRTFPYKLIVLLSLSDLFGSISYLIPTSDLITESATGQVIRHDTSAACIIQASMSQFFDVATFMWTAVFSFNIYEVLVQKRSNVEEFERYYHLVCWGIPGIFLAINLAVHSFGPTLVWCWIDSSFNSLRIATFYAPLVIIFIVNLVFYLLIGKSLRSMGEDKQVAINSRLRQYLLIFFFVRIWSLINRFQNVVQPNQPVFFLYFMHSLFSTLQGFCNSIVYGLNVRVRAHYEALCCCRRGAKQSLIGTGVTLRSDGHPLSSPSPDSSDNSVDSSSPFGTSPLTFPGSHTQQHYSPRNTNRYHSFLENQ